AEIPVQINLGEEQRQVLEVLRVKERPPVVPPFRDLPPVAHDVLVVGQKQIVGQLRPVEEQPQVVVEAGDVVLVKPLVLRGLQVGRQALEARNPEEAKQPLVEHQPLLEAQGPLGGAGVCSGASGGSRRHGHFPSTCGFPVSSSKSRTYSSKRKRRLRACPVISFNTPSSASRCTNWLAAG